MRLSIFIALLSLSFIGHAQEAQQQPAQLPGIDNLTPLPINGLIMIESQGKQIFVTPGGRFAITGTLRDMWTNEIITDSEGVKKMSKVPVQKITSIQNDLGILTHGDGEDVYAFVDPNCGYCKQLFDFAKNNDQYRFHFILTPMLGKQSQTDTVQMWCAGDKQAATMALLGHEAKTSLVQSVDCDKGPIVKNMTFAKILGVQGVPFLVRGDGQTSRGLPKDFAGWLREDAS